MPEIHLTARQRATIAALLTDDANVARLGACSIATEADYVVVKFAGRDVVCVDENGEVI
jgi:hypothetical protein